MVSDYLKSKIKSNPEIILAEKCKRSFYFFLKTFWPVIIEEEFIDAMHIRYLCQELQYHGERVIKRLPKEADTIINVPPGTTKSTICTVMFPAWLWTRDCTLRIMTGSFSATLATDHAVKSRDIILSPKYRIMFPHVKLKYDQNNKTHYKTTKNGERYAVGIHGAVMGFHAHVHIIDDPVDPKAAASDDMRQSANEFFSKVLPSRKVDKKNTPLFLIMQRLHQDDPTGYILSKKKVNHIKLPGKISDKIRPLPEELASFYTNGLLDPKRLDQEILDEMAIDLGSVQYSCQFDQEPGDPEGIIFKRDWFEIVDINHLPSELFSQTVYMNADTAQKVKTTNDPSAFLSWCMYENTMYIFEWFNKKMEFPELCREVKNFWARNGTTGSIMDIEPKSSGSSVVQQIRTTTKLNVIEYDMPDGDKITRSSICTPYGEAKRIKLIKGHWNEEFLNQVTGFPKAKHDEAVDNITMAVQRSFIRGGIKASGRKWIVTN